jgi:hypothetical protein
VNPKNFFGELKRRNVYKVAIAYAVVAWVLIQVATQVFPFFEIPNWVVRRRLFSALDARAVNFFETSEQQRLHSTFNQV